MANTRYKDVEQSSGRPLLSCSQSPRQRWCSVVSVNLAPESSNSPAWPFCASFTRRFPPPSPPDRQIVAIFRVVAARAPWYTLARVQPCTCGDREGMRCTYVGYVATYVSFRDTWRSHLNFPWESYVSPTSRQPSLFSLCLSLPSSSSSPPSFRALPPSHLSPRR